MEKNAALEEVCLVEGNDDLHEFGGGHGNKGNDFARFWLINELFALGQTGTTDYVFILEYVQDIARLDIAADPAQITLYQLKKKEGSSWDLNSLAGLTRKATTVRPDSPLAKLLKGVLCFKTMTTTAEFVSNAKFKLELEAGGNALSMDYVSLEELTKERREHIRTSAATAHGVKAEDVPLSRVGLRYAPIEVNDMRVHVIGNAHGFLKQLSTTHAAQADSFVDALFAKLATASRNTSKCKTWDELISKRGYRKKQFDEALAALQLLPDQHKRREDLLKNVADAFGWHSREQMKVEVALTELARLKLTKGEVSIGIDLTALAAIHSQAEAAHWSEAEEFFAVEELLAEKLPEETQPRIRALAIYALVEAWTNQTFA